MLLAIETSCDETGVAIFGDTFASPVVELLATQTSIHQAYGGVVPELAARQHILNLPVLVQEAMARAGCEFSQLSAIAVTRGPGLRGSLLVGVAYAKGLASALRVPVLGLNHLEGHLAAGFLRDTKAPAIAGEGARFDSVSPVLSYPYLALLVSGGHTLLVLVKGFRQYQLVAETLDDAAGEAFDKIATLLGLPYPGGPSLSRAAAAGDSGKFKFPIALPADEQSFSFSGLKTAVSREVERWRGAEEFPVADLAASAQGSIVRALVEKSIAACKKYSPQGFLLTGGVAANAALREALAGELKLLGVPFVVPATKWCTDNAAMIGVLAQQMLERGQCAESSKDWGPLARWPLAVACS